jgi:hypothetical protein
MGHRGVAVRDPRLSRTGPGSGAGLERPATCLKGDDLEPSDRFVAWFRAPASHYSPSERARLLKGKSV